MSLQGIHAHRHERLADELRKVFQESKPGSRVDSMEAIAAQYDVSVNTARMALILLQHEGWVRVRHGSGSYVSRPKSEPRRHIAILSEYNLLLSPRGAAFYHRVMHELRLFLKSKGQSSRLYIGHVMSERPPPDTLTCTEFLEDLALDRIGGIAALATLPFFSWTEQAKAKRIPIVGMHGWHFRFNGAVDPDFAGAIHDAVLSLVGHGRRRPAFIGWDERGCAAFKTIVAESGLTADARRIRAGLKPLDPGAGWSDFREIWAASEEKPDSVIFGDDVLFQDALPAIQQADLRIPEELEIVVLANKGIPLPCPFPYTRLDCDPGELAAEMGRLLLQLMAGEEPSRRQIMIPYRPAVNPADGVAGNGQLPATEAVRTMPICDIGIKS
jgi:DNA-binding LacI/PurR family transcriptional regulator